MTQDEVMLAEKLIYTILAKFRTNLVHSLKKSGLDVDISYVDVKSSPCEPSGCDDDIGSRVVNIKVSVMFADPNFVPYEDIK